jgi:hypothetical protein
LRKDSSSFSGAYEYTRGMGIVVDEFFFNDVSITLQDFVHVRVVL